MFKDKKSLTSVNALECIRKFAAIIACNSLCLLSYDFLSSFIFVYLPISLIEIASLPPIRSEALPDQTAKAKPNRPSAASPRAGQETCPQDLDTKPDRVFFIHCIPSYRRTAIPSHRRSHLPEMEPDSSYW